jgi:hypothetical protein
MNKPFHLAANRELFLAKLEKVVNSLGCKGKIPNEPVLPESQPPLSQEDILMLQVMMQDKEGVLLSLQLGADPCYERKGNSLIRLAKAYGVTDIVDLLKEYGAELKAKQKFRPNSG